MSILIDTNVVSEATRPKADPHVIERLNKEDPRTVFMSVITIGEIEYGIKRLSPGKRRLAFEAWLADLEQQYVNRIVSVDLETVHVWGRITAESESRGVRLPAADGLIAATALRHGMALMTRNLRDFHDLGLTLIDPWNV